MLFVDRLDCADIGKHEVRTLHGLDCDKIGKYQDPEVGLGLSQKLKNTDRRIKTKGLINVTWHASNKAFHALAISKDLSSHQIKEVLQKNSHHDDEVSSERHLLAG